jgi:lipopolysaccharide/colanic/teichoic acid biosynthesis glycosyltransferase
MIRFFDVLFSVCAIIILAPLLLPVIVFLRFSGEGEVFYFQDRIGQHDKIFSIFKFATMLKDSPNMNNAYITTKDDPRVLPLGKFLRKSKLNELPQLINILKGDLSLVGPRPQVREHLEMYPPEKRKQILAIKPGLTGIASLFFRDEESMVSKSKIEPKEFYKNFIVPYKVELELWYKDNQNLFTYFALIYLTAWNILFPKSKLYKSIFRDLPKPDKELIT